MWFKVQTPTEIMLSLATTNKSAHTWLFTEWICIVTAKLLLTTTCQSSTGRPIFLSQLQWQTATGQSKAKKKLHHKPENLASKKLHTFGCKYLGLHTVYGLETLGLESYSPLLACKVLHYFMELSSFLFEGKDNSYVSSH